MNKKKGFVLIFVMLIISALTLLVIGVSSLTVQSKNKSSIFSQKQEEDIILNNSIECIFL